MLKTSPFLIFSISSALIDKVDLLGLKFFIALYNKKLNSASVIFSFPFLATILIGANVRLDLFSHLGGLASDS